MAVSSVDLCRFWDASLGGGRASKFSFAHLIFAWSLSGNVFGSSLPNFSRILKADLLVLYARVEAFTCAREEEGARGPILLVFGADLVNVPTVAVGQVRGGAALSPCFEAGVIEVLEEGTAQPLEVVVRDVEADIKVLTLNCGLETEVPDEGGCFWIAGFCRFNPVGSLLGLASLVFCFKLDFWLSMR